MRRVWYFCRGYAKIQLEGLHIMRCLAQQAAQGVVLWRVERLSYTCVQAYIALPQLQVLHGALQNSAVQVLVLGRYGLPVLWRGAARRWGLLVGALLCVAALYTSNAFVLHIAVQGCDDDPLLAQNILAAARQEGLAAPCRKASFDRLAVQRRIHKRVQGLSFLSLDIRGVRAVIRIQRETPAPELLDEKTPYQVVAARDAVVTRVSAVTGQACVAPGDTVRAGQVLIGHIVPRSDGSVRAVHARGEVWARAWLEGEAWQPLLAVHSRYTGRSSTSFALQWGCLVWNLPAPGVEYEWCTTESRQYYLLGHAGPRFVVFTARELAAEDMRLDEQLARQTALAEAYEKAAALLPAGAQVVERIDHCSIDSRGRLCARVSLEILENIAVEVPIAAGGT